MKKHKIIICLFVLSIVGMFKVNGQETAGKSNDFQRIILSTYIPDEQLVEIPPFAINTLKTKLRQITSSYGMGSENFDSQFVITANITELSKTITPTAPKLTSVVLELTLYIGDGDNGTLFSNQSFELKGVGKNPSKAYIDALKKLNTQNPMLKEFVAKGKNKIIDYYNNNCSFILTKGETLAAQQKYDEAMSLLSSIPEVSQDCFQKAMSAIVPIYKKKINLDCKKMLAQAINVWNAEQTVDAAKESIDYLFAINPDADCFAEAQNFSKKLSKEVKKLNDRELELLIEERNQNWELQKLEIKSNAELQKVAIQAIQNMNVAYQRNENNTFKNIIRSWFNK